MPRLPLWGLCDKRGRCRLFGITHSIPKKFQVSRKRCGDVLMDLKTLEESIERAELRDGATLSFHHHLRNGDAVLNGVLAACAARRLRELHVAASSIFPVHAPLVDHIQEGVVGQISTGFVSGPVALAISHGRLPNAVRLQTHGGRAREIDEGELVIDAAFVAASSVDHAGNLSGRVGPRAFGAMGYPQSDVRAARWVTGVTDHLSPTVVGISQRST